MKLLEILARDLNDWPESVACMVQNEDSTIVKMGKTDVFYTVDYWKGADGHSIVGFTNSSRQASDQPTAIVTREAWEKARADYLAGKGKTAKPVKSNKGGWIRHRGGKCPVSNDVMVEVRLRNGKEWIGKEAELAFEWYWQHSDTDADIMAYRICEPAEQTEGEKVMRECVDKCASTEKADPFDPVRAIREAHEAGAVLTVRIGEQEIDGPLWWRDRIRVIDRTVEALEEERASLIQRLEGEGLQLLRVDAKVCGSAQPVEDMSDWRNWRAGDVVVFIREDGESDCFTFGKQYVVADINTKSYNPVAVEADDDGDYNGWKAKYFKFHSRPQ